MKIHLFFPPLLLRLHAHQRPQPEPPRNDTARNHLRARTGASPRPHSPDTEGPELLGDLPVPIGAEPSPGEVPGGAAGAGGARGRGGGAPWRGAGRRERARGSAAWARSADPINPPTGHIWVKAVPCHCCLARSKQAAPLVPPISAWHSRAGGGGSHPLAASPLPLGLPCPLLIPGATWSISTFVSSPACLLPAPFFTPKEIFLPICSLLANQC